jgi:hypothetical protein
MPKYKNGKVMCSRFKVQGLIRSKGHFDLLKKNIQGGTLRNLLLLRIFSKSEGKKFFFKYKIKR